MLRIGFEERELLIREVADHERERIVALPKNSVTHDASQLARATRRVIGERRIGKRFEAACFGVALDLAVPRGGIKLCEPRAKRRQLPSGQSAYLRFELLDVRHGASDVP